jgi:hypothetical protein
MEVYFAAAQPEVKPPQVMNSRSSHVLFFEVTLNFNLRMVEPFVNFFTAIPWNSGAPDIPAGYYLDGFYQNTVDYQGKVWLEIS